MAKPTTTDAFVPVGAGVSALLQDGKLVLAIDVSEAAVKRAPLSKGGKMNLLASTGGWVFAPIAGLPAGLKLNVMVGVPAAK